MTDNAVDPAVARFLVNEQKSIRFSQEMRDREGTIEERRKADKLWVNVNTEAGFKEICNRLRNRMMQLNELPTTDRERFRWDPSSDYIATAYLGNIACTLSFKHAATNGLGTNPYIEIDLPDHENLSKRDRIDIVPLKRESDLHGKVIWGIMPPRQLYPFGNTEEVAEMILNTLRVGDSQLKPNKNLGPR
jgi:hypothetical protein